MPSWDGGEGWEEPEAVLAPSSVPHVENEHSIYVERTLTYLVEGVVCGKGVRSSCGRTGVPVVGLTGSGIGSSRRD